LGSLPASALVVLVGYVAGITAFGTWLGRRQRTLQGYFLAGRTVPWWAIAACIVATETSTLTFIGVPGMAYLGNWGFLQLAAGYVLGRILVSALLLPAYFRGEIYTSYEVLQQRFGPAVRTVAAAIFLLYRTLGDGIRLHAAALVLAVAFGGKHIEWIFILVLGIAMIVYTEEGGVTATIWTDAIQMFVYLAGAIVCLVAVATRLPQGALAALESAWQAGKLQVVDARWDLTQPYTLWAGLIGGVFLTVATHGTDHYLVQRLLVARGRRDASIGLVLSGFVVFAQFALFLVLGTLLWAHYAGRTFARGDEVLPTFVSTELPGVFAGVILAAIVAAALSPSLNSMASATVRDFYLPFVRPGADERQQLRVARVFTAVWGLAQIAVAMLAQGIDSALNEGLAALGYASGPTVGAFLLGVLTRSARSAPTMIGMIVGLATSLSVGKLAPFLLGRPGVAWTWNVAIGAVVTFVVGWLASRLTRPGSTVGGKSAGSSMAGVVVLGVLLTSSPAAAQDWHDAYRAGLRALSRGQHADAAAALQRAIALHPEPGRNLLTYGTNVEPRYFPYLRLAEARLALGQLDAAREALEASASWGTREPADERRALLARLEAAVAARRPAPPASTPPQPPTPAAPTPAPSAVATPSPSVPPTPALSGPAQPAPAPPPVATPLPAGTPIHSTRTTPAAPGPAEPPTGVIEVISQPAGAAVYVDDELAGDTDPQTGRLVKRGLAPGKHRVRVALAGYDDAAREVDVSSGTVTFYATLRSVATASTDGRGLLVAFAVLAVAVIAVVAWMAFRQPASTGAPPRTPSVRTPTSPDAAATPRTFMNPGARLDEQGLEWFGDYRLHEMLGRGGMASVFRAERRSELVALKRPLASFLDDQPFLDRFLREAEIGRTLNHPSIVRILERGEVLGVPYFTMELVPGETLLSYLKREHSAEPRFAARVVAQVAEGLDLAHHKGVVHRDLKPSNIMLLPDGHARVMDFGIARAQRFDTLTATSAFMGTPHYVAPEMIEGAGAEPRSDLYALGVVLFELLTGQRPFDADTPFAILKKHCLEEPQAPSRLKPGLPRELDEIVLRLLRKDVAERPANAETLVIALRDFLNRAA
jgi:SSS family transporter